MIIDFLIYLINNPAIQAVLIIAIGVSAVVFFYPPWSKSK